jgi:hypothetical protein
MRLTDIIIAQDLEENIFSGVAGAAKGLMKGAPIKGYQSGYAQGAGNDQIKQLATVIYKDFYNRMGQIGKEPTAQYLIQYLQQHQYPTKEAGKILSGASTIPPQGNAAPANPETKAAPSDNSAAGINADRERIMRPDDGNINEDANTALDSKIIWQAVLAASRENIMLGGAAQYFPKAGVNFAGGNATQDSGNTAPASTGGGTISASGAVTGGGGNTSVNTEPKLSQAAVLGYYKSLKPAAKQNLRTKLDSIDAKAAAGKQTNALSASGGINTFENYSRFLGREL